MATTKSIDKDKKMPIAEVRKRVKELEEELEAYKDKAYCPMCEQFKDRKKGFYLDKDPIFGHDTCSRICRECAKKIALRVDSRGEHSPTKESAITALKYINKPFLSSLWNSSIAESENKNTGKTKDNAWTSYVKNIQMRQYASSTFFDSDFYKTIRKIDYDKYDKTEAQIIQEHSGQDTYDSFLKNREDVIRLLNYDPFENEEVEDQPLMFSQLLGLLDASEDANDDMMRTASCISIVRGFSQLSKIDDTIATLMSDIFNIEKNSATIKSLEDSKGKISSNITTLAEHSCISLKHNKNAKKGENTWTGKIKKIKDLNLRSGEVNGFDIATSRGMQQVQEISDASIMKQLALDESDWSDMVAEMRVTNTQLRRERDNYKEINRILLRENLDLKDLIAESNIIIDKSLADLKDLYSVFASDEEYTDENSSESEDE